MNTASAAMLGYASDGAAVQAHEFAYRRSPDQDASPPIEFLKRGLDVEDAGSLASVLAGGGEPDPTQTTETSPTS